MSDVVDRVKDRIADYAQTHRRTKLSKRGVRRCNEFDRIDSLPRREWSDPESEQLATELTAMLAQPGGSQRLRPIQAIALYEMAQVGGLLGPIGVGAGKTLITLLAPVVLGAKRPLLILPAKLVDKTKREMRELMMHWRVHPNITIKSFEWLGRVQAKSYLNDTLPDLLVLDEAHRIRNLKAARTRRIKRYADEHGVKMVALSGTLVRKRVNDWAHLAAMTLKDGSPAPRKWNTIAHWGAALDHDAKIPPGVLSAWEQDGETTREAYQRRVAATPGVVATETGLVGVALNGFAWSKALPADLVMALDDLARDWILPDGFTVTDPLHYYRAARQLALGVYYRWVYQPPEEWRDARLYWSRFVRHACRYMRDNGTPFDSELQVANAVTAGRVDDGGILANWREWRPRFTPEVEHVWVTDSIVEELIAFAHSDKPALVWIEISAVGDKMQSLGLDYYGRQQRTADGRHILDASPKQSIALSMNSCDEGLNLQAWQRAIYTAPTADATKWEQTLGRYHRPGQQADELEVHIAQLAEHHEESWFRALYHARFLQETTGQQQKLLQMTLAEMPYPNGWHD